MYQNDEVFLKFNAAINDVNQNDLDPTILFIATDGQNIFKAFTAPATAVDGDFYISEGFDENTYMGVWSHDWIRKQILEMDEVDDPEAAWQGLMESMVRTIAGYLDDGTPPKDGN